MEEEIASSRDDESSQQPAEELDRMAEPVDAEQPPRLPFPVVGIGASAGGLEAVGEFLDAMPSESGMAFVLVQHLPPDRESLMAEVLARHTVMPVRQVEDGMPVEPDHAYVIRPGHVLTIREGRLHLGPPLGTARAANRPIDDFFRSLAEEQRERAVSVVMSGMGSNGTAGAQAVKAVGGLCIAQDPESAKFPSMPQHLIDAGYADYILRPADMPDVLVGYAQHPYTRGVREADAVAALRREGHHLREILAVLRTRTRQDFTGYKKPTLLRRVQRRMGLTRVETMDEYARLLRQSPAEVTALADDLLIHVTGFFRDPEAWEALRRQVIAPLVDARESGAAVRAWVTACSSGEEAYTLAMVLVEESERAGKRLDIKVFATDLANRALSHARAGVYPGGIESELTAERLERFFTRDDAVYQVKPALRDRVVFAPQNVLQDPPFSRLDIATCRNLMIYLEPEVQQRVLALMHFGLREGGALFLGSSETVAGADDLFEPVDKRARIYRRVGPTRHGSAEFPLPHALTVDDEGIRGAAGDLARFSPRRRDVVRPSLAQLTQRELLEAHAPPAVTVDRDGRILYYHGDTRPYLQQLSGEPTRDLLLLSREGVRGAARAALNRAAAEGEKAGAADGWVEVEPGRRVRVAVTASPVVAGFVPGEKRGPPDYFVVSFAERGDFSPPAVEGPEGRGEVSAEEMRRLRAELQTTIEEVQGANEELKASNEEVMSINEELQSANEELETSKEEMQSLNEELSTVNAQLRAKVEEHQAASSDLGNLLASTDIAVLFLDTAFRIRRYTPAIRELVDLIASDVGRPLAALARRFDDPDLDDDARAVLERLVPVEREVSGGGRHFLRRALPYRTTDNRIDGVVITFVDISPRKRAEQALRASEERLRRMLNIKGVGVRILDRSGMVVEANDAFLTMSGYAREQVAARALHWRAMTPPEALEEGERQMEQLAATGRVGPNEKEYISRDGSRSWMLFAGADLGDGTTIEYTIDITDKRWVAEALRASEERLRLALSAARMGIWTWDVTADVQTRDAYLNRLLGREPVESTQPLTEFLGHIHPDDRATVADAFASSVARGWPLNVEFRVVWTDGSVRWLRDQGDIFGEIRGGSPHMAGACVDVTEVKAAEVALRSSEERLRLVVASATDYAILTLDTGRRITGWSPGAEAVFGYAEAEALGRPFDIVFTPEDRAAGVPEEEVRTALRDGRAGDERWHARKDGSRFFASGVLNRLGEGGSLGLVKVLRDLTDRKEVEDALRGARDDLEARVTERTAELSRANVGRLELMRRLVRAQEDERRRVSLELHDGLGQELTALILGLKALEEAIPEGSPGHDRLREVEASAVRIGREAHDLAVELRPTALDDVGLHSALAAQVARWSERTGIAADFQALGADHDRLPPEVETALYRVVQEALNNVARHSGATRVSVILERRGGEVTALVEDDGRGFDPAEVAGIVTGSRLGLLGMRERIALVGGTLLIDSGEGEGTILRARIPLQATTGESGHGD